MVARHSRPCVAAPKVTLPPHKQRRRAAPKLTPQLGQVMAWCMCSFTIGLVGLYSLVAALSPSSLPDNRRPWVIAHRGASGTLPEHTREAYLLAIQQASSELHGFPENRSQSVSCLELKIATVPSAALMAQVVARRVDQAIYSNMAVVSDPISQNGSSQPGNAGLCTHHKCTCMPTAASSSHTASDAGPSGNRGCQCCSYTQKNRCLLAGSRLHRMRCGIDERLWPDLPP